MQSNNTALGVILVVVLTVLVLRDTWKSSELESLRAAHSQLYAQTHRVRRDIDTQTHRVRRDIDAQSHRVRREINKEIGETEDVLKAIIRKEINRPLSEKIKLLLPDALNVLPAKHICSCKGSTSEYEVISKGNANGNPTVKIRGLKGDTGLRGPPGPRGAKGEPGEKGLSLIKPIMVLADLNKTVRVGANQTFSCRVFGNPIPTVEWKLQNDSSKIVTTTLLKNNSEVISYLTVSDIRWEDRGNITCSASSILGGVESQGYLYVQIKPRVSVARKLLVVYLETNITFPTCDIVAFPKPVITWTKGFGKLPTGRSVQDNGVLIIHNVKYQDDGFYICTAKNSIGTSKVVVQLKTKAWEDLGITSMPPLFINVLTYPYEVTCGAQGDSRKMKAKWKSLTTGKVLKAQMNTSLGYVYITTTLTEDGYYICEFVVGKKIKKVGTNVKKFELESSILTTTVMKQQLISFLNGIQANTRKLINFKNCFKFTYSSRNVYTKDQYGRGWKTLVKDNLNEFNAGCENKRNILTLAKLGTTIIGGYIESSWKEVYSASPAKTSLLLFSNHDDKYKLKLVENVNGTCKTSEKYAPCFGTKALSFRGGIVSRKSFWYVTSSIFKTKYADKEIDDMETFYLD